MLDEPLARYGREIQVVAYLLLRDRLEAEDVLIETLPRRPTVARRCATRVPCARGCCASRPTMRWDGGATSAASSTCPWRRSAVTTIATPAGRVVLLQVLETLPARTRAAVVLHYADLPVAEMAAAMGTSPNTVKTQLRHDPAIRGELAHRPSGRGALRPPATALPDGRVLAVGGSAANATTTVSPFAEILDPTMEAFTTLPVEGTTLDLMNHCAVPLTDA